MSPLHDQFSQPILAKAGQNGAIAAAANIVGLGTDISPGGAM